MMKNYNYSVSASISWESSDSPGVPLYNITNACSPAVEIPLGVADRSKHIGLFSNLDLNILREVPFPMPTEIMTQNKNGTILHSYTSIKDDRQPCKTATDIHIFLSHTVHNREICGVV